MARAKKGHTYVGQQPMFTPPSDWTPPKVSELPSWEGISRIGLDTETKDPELTKLGPGVRRGAKIIGISFAIEDHRAFYLPIRHPEGNLNPQHVFDYLRDQARVFTGDICGANLQYDLDFLAEEGVIFRRAGVKDIQIAEPLIDENQLSYSLDTLAKKYGFMGKEEGLLKEAAAAYGVDPKKGMWRLPAKYVGPYAEPDAMLPLQILRKQERVIDDQEIWEIYKLECRVLPVLVKMRRRGVRIDFDQLEKVERVTVVEEQKQLDIIHHATGVRIQIDEINKKPPIVRALKQQNIPITYTNPTKSYPNGQPSIKADTLNPYKDNPVVAAIIEAKAYNKVRNTFVESIRKHQTNGRIHCTFNQLRRQDDNSDDVKGAGPGRLSSCDPNLQQQPARHPVLGKLWRSIYLPDEGGRWAALDYSQQEPRLFVHYAHISGCPGTQAAVDGFHAGYDWHDMTTKMAFGLDKPGPDASAEAKKHFKFMRGRAKAVFLGLTYGMGQAKMCRSCGFDTEMVDIRGAQREVAGPEGKAFLAEFNAKVPFLNAIKQMTEAVAWNRRYIKTILGRHIHYPPGLNMERKALNNLIQGSAADQTKLAMVLMDENNYRIQLQIHDEIDTTVYSEQTAKEMAEIMSTCVPLVVPSKVDIEIGDNWGDSME